jgi:hypothetical protein
MRHLLRVLRYHNSTAGRAFRASRVFNDENHTPKRVNVDGVCPCDMCKHALAVFKSINVTL